MVHFPFVAVPKRQPASLAFALLPFQQLYNSRTHIRAFS